MKLSEFIQEFGQEIGLMGQVSCEAPLTSPDVHRPGLAITGYLKGFSPKRILVIGKNEIEYLKGVSDSRERLKSFLTSEIPAIIVARRLRPPEELAQICAELKIPLLRSSLTTTVLVRKLTLALSEAFAPKKSCHGTLVQIHGLGVLIQGESSVGKSETALGLIERGHRLISDDIVQIRKKEEAYLEGVAPELTKHLLEIRGIGIINVAHLFGAVCVNESARIDLIVRLEIWNEKHFYDRVGLEEHYENLLGVKVPLHVVPVKPGRDMVLLLETIALNYRLKKMGYHSAKEFNAKLLDAIARRSKTD
ncbi:MAG: HPr(Ser) kinase/phosphatase [Candidatus Algichlamydia australiensis]|nr:HPr(Ser) kinase/phosphatase [Chlamydiales bacterium]